MATTETLADIEIELVAAKWAWLHAIWAGEPNLAETAWTLIDELLELRYRLAPTHPGDWPG
jgi:hypothetical protein